MSPVFAGCKEIQLYAILPLCAWLPIQRSFPIDTQNFFEGKQVFEIRFVNTMNENTIS